ncbi:MAG: hypothetical protein QM758_18840 [Armatimonas sp.]
MRILCLILAGAAIVIGGACGLVGTIYLTSSRNIDVMGAGAIFIGGCILIGSGVIGLSLLAPRRSVSE